MTQSPSPVGQLPIYSNTIQKKNIAFVTSDTMGPMRCGGVGTATYALAESLAKTGHQVTILLHVRDQFNLIDFPHWQAAYWRVGINLMLIPPPEVPIEARSPSVASYGAYLYLKEKNLKYHWDIIYFSDMHGLGYYSMQAKKTLGHFENCILCVIGHGPSAWAKEFNNQGPSQLSDVEYNYLEKLSIKNSDVFIAPSFSALDWLNRENWQLPKNTFVAGNLVPQNSIAYTSTRSKLKDVIFFSRLEFRKGLDIFIDAVKKLDASILNQINIIFLGQNGVIHNQPSNEWIVKSLSKTNVRFQIVSHLGSKEALSFIQGHQPLVVVPSRAETFGYSLLECVDANIPVIASKIPVFEELIEPVSHNAALFELESSSLAQKIEVSLKIEFPKIRRRQSNQEIVRLWSNWNDTVSIHEINPPSASKIETVKQPLVSICIPHKDRPVFLESCLNSLKNQTFKNFEVLIGDDGSTKMSSKAYLKILENKNDFPFVDVIYFDKSRGPGFVRNRLAEKAKGEFLLFMDDDNFALKNELEIFVNAAIRTGADILTCFFDRVHDVTELRADDDPVRIGRWAPLGNAPAMGFVVNSFGDMNAFVKTKVFKEVGGLNEEKNLPGEDWDFFAKACLRGYSLEVIPEALFLYTQHDDNYSYRTEAHKSVRTLTKTYADNMNPNTLKDLLWYLRGVVDSIHRVELKPVPKTIANRSLYNDPADVRSQFSRSLLELTADNFTTHVVPNDQVKIRRFGNIIGLVASGSDPSIILPSFPIEKNRRLLMQVELVTKVQTLFTVYFKTVENSVYCEEQTQSFPLLPGRNVFQIIFNGNLDGELRVDPSTVSTTLALKSLSLSAEM